MRLHGARLAAAALLALPSAALAQAGEHLTVRGANGSLTLRVESERGYAVVSDSSLLRLGWRLEIGAEGVVAALPGGVRVRLGFDTPFFLWEEDVLQLTDPAYVADGRVYVPVQLLVDFLPARLDVVYRFNEADFVLEILDEDVWSVVASDVGVARPASEAAVDAVRLEARPVETAPPSRPLVVIDPGHGGRDPGTIGSSGRSEKDIALRIGLALARELRRDGDLDVRMTRDTDVLVPIWDRGKRATAWKGDRPGIFISLHANALPSQRSVRGFETYFLSDARTDHERRVAENENAPLGLEAAGDPAAENPDLDFILRELRNFDYQHWSSVLAESIQNALESVHTGPSRGVKQGPFAVITNALMPAVLIEFGFLTNRQDERLLFREDFQEGAARAIAGAVRGFFERYPPGRVAPAPGGGG
ncbi:MAG: N-acetylmuramoyl-L-alanine amidase [Longimicrobiales bacterium]